MRATGVRISWRRGLGSCLGGIELAGRNEAGGVVVRMLSMDQARVICAVMDLLGDGHSWTAALSLRLPHLCLYGSGEG